MRSIGSIENEQQARRFSDYLFAEGIENDVEPSADERWTIWVHSEDHLHSATEKLNAFRVDPDAAVYREAAGKAESLRAKKRREEQVARKRMHDLSRSSRTGSRKASLTLLLMAASVGVTLIAMLSDQQAVRPLMFSNYLRPVLPEIRSGQLWRVITPIFIHFGFLHLLFNMFWLMDLGSMVERARGAMHLGLMVLVIAVVSNCAQYMSSGNPNFGGMSGVVYGLLGYVWMMARFRPGEGLFMHPVTILTMMVWLFLGFFGLLGPIANTIHAVGLGLGLGWGLIESGGWRQIFQQ